MTSIVKFQAIIIVHFYAGLSGTFHTAPSGPRWCLGDVETLLMVQGSWRIAVTGDRGEPPSLVKHISYSAVKMAASEGARSGRTTAKRS